MQLCHQASAIKQHSQLGIFLAFGIYTCLAQRFKVLKQFLFKPGVILIRYIKRHQMSAHAPILDMCFLMISLLYVV